MSRFGIWQLKKLTLQYCGWGGNSRGARAFRERFAESFREDNPQLTFIEVERRNHAPLLLGEYRNGNRRIVDLKNKDEEEILRLAYHLRSAAGRKTTKPLDRHVLPAVWSEELKAPVRASPSVQGPWKPSFTK